ncbi:GNAT family N-acetyltransferase [Xylanimonas protaetiae]|uniref:GNAT family N-acetyltransferase n=1 Tax=Xylanimonas protaetiae TaxID=2509457 RepID=UPI0013EDF359|nr:N-acetyltransferase [Xylanimonas protaetiae]
MLTLTRYDGADAAALSELVHGVYAEQYPPGPDFSQWRDGQWARHRSRAEFALCVAREGDDVAGLIWSYLGGPGQYWTDAVQESLAPGVGQEWLGGHLEIVELVVRPAFRRRGIAARLLGSAVASTSARRALLTVRDGALPARALYESLGFTPLGRAFGDMTVMGLEVADGRCR